MSLLKEHLGLAMLFVFLTIGSFGRDCIDTYRESHGLKPLPRGDGCSCGFGEEPKR